MRYLITEMALLLMATAIIAWLGGRFLCKRGEKELRIKTNQLSGKHAALSDQHSKLEAKYERLSKKAEQLETEVSEALEDRSGLRMQLDEVTMERDDGLAKVQKLEGFREDLKASQDEVDDLRLQLVEERSGHDAALQKAAFLEQEYDEALKRLEELTNQSDTLHIELSKLNTASVDYKDRLQNAMMTHTEMTDEMREMSRERDELQRQVKTLMEERRSIAETAASPVQLVPSSEDTSGQLAADFAQEEITRLQAQIRSVEEERDSYEHRLSKALADVDTNDNIRVDSAHWDKVSLRTELESLKSDYRQLQQHYDDIMVERNDYLGRLRAIASVVEMIGNSRSDSKVNETSPSHSKVG